MKDNKIDAPVWTNEYMRLILTANDNEMDAEASMMIAMKWYEEGKFAAAAKFLRDAAAEMYSQADNIAKAAGVLEQAK